MRSKEPIYSMILSRMTPSSSLSIRQFISPRAVRGSDYVSRPGQTCVPLSSRLAGRGTSSLLLVQALEGFSDNMVFGPVDGRGADDILRTGHVVEL